MAVLCSAARGVEEGCCAASHSPKRAIFIECLDAGSDRGATGELVRPVSVYLLVLCSSLRTAPKPRSVGNPFDAADDSQLREELVGDSSTPAPREKSQSQNKTKTGKG